MPQTNAIYNLAAVEASTEQVPVVGYTVLWRLHGLRVKHDQLKDALDRAGFLEFLPDPPTPRKSLRRALQAWVVARVRSGAGHIHVDLAGKMIISTRDSGCY